MSQPRSSVPFAKEVLPEPKKLEIPVPKKDKENILEPRKLMGERGGKSPQEKADLVSPNSSEKTRLANYMAYAAYLFQRMLEDMAKSWSKIQGYVGVALSKKVIIDATSYDLPTPKPDEPMAKIAKTVSKEDKNTLEKLLREILKKFKDIITRYKGAVDALDAIHKSCYESFKELCASAPGSKVLSFEAFSQLLDRLATLTEAQQASQLAMVFSIPSVVTSTSFPTPTPSAPVAVDEVQARDGDVGETKPSAPEGAVGVTPPLPEIEGVPDANFVGEGARRHDTPSPTPEGVPFVEATPSTPESDEGRMSSATPSPTPEGVVQFASAEQEGQRFISQFQMLVNSSRDAINDKHMVMGQRLNEMNALFSQTMQIQKSYGEASGVQQILAQINQAQQSMRSSTPSAPTINTGKS